MSEWGPWFEHDGKGCPLPVGTSVEVEYRHECHFASNGVRTGEFGRFRKMRVRSIGESWAYGHPDLRDTWSTSVSGRKSVPIIRYRIRKPLGLTILQEIAADPQPVSPERIDA